MTNKDKLIERFSNMSAENLMDWLEALNNNCEGCLVDDCRDNETCRESYIRWLKKEYKDTSVKCPYCGACPEEFITQLKAYIPVDISRDGVVSIDHLEDHTEDIKQAMIGCIGDEVCECYCYNCGKTFELADFSINNSVLTLTSVKKKEQKD